MHSSKTAAFIGGAATVLILGGGTAVAATAVTLSLGHTNTSKVTTTLVDRQGIPLALKAKGSTPALSVNTTAQVKNFNAELLDGHHASAFLPALGKAADSDLLNGQPASAFLPAQGSAADALKLGGLPATNYLGTVFAAHTDSSVPGGSAPLLNPVTAFDSFTVPPGTYSVSLSIGLTNHDPSQGDFGCDILYTEPAGQMYGYEGRANLDPAATGDIYGGVATTQIIVLPTATTIAADCFANHGNASHTADVYQSSLSATRIQDLHGDVSTFVVNG